MTDELSVTLQLIPLLLFLLIVFCKVFSSHLLWDALASLLETEALLYIAFVSILMLATSLASDVENSFATAMLIAACLVAARLYMFVVTLQEVLDAFFWSGVLSIGLLALAAFSPFMNSVQTLERFSPFSFHPNTLGFLSAGYFCVMVWKCWGSRWPIQILAVLIATICLLFAFFASSRGSLVGISAGVFFAVVVSVVKTVRMGQFKLRSGWVLTSLGMVILLVALSVFNSSKAQDFYEFSDKVLAITESHRGIDSGFTGRFEKWRATLLVLTDGSWLVGKGMRSSDLMADNLIDNGYLVVLYEIGLVPLILITWRFVTVTLMLCRAYLDRFDRQDALLCLGCAMLMATFLVNDIVARYLFSVGNGFSLFAMLIFAAPSSRLLTRPKPSIHFDENSCGRLGGFVPIRNS